MLDGQSYAYIFVNQLYQIKNIGNGLGRMNIFGLCVVIRPMRPPACNNKRRGLTSMKIRPYRCIYIYLSIRLPVCLCFINITTNHLSLNPSLNPSIAPSIYIYNHLSCMYLFEYVCLTIVITTWIITFSNGQISFFGCLRSRLSIISKWFISYISRHWMKNQDRPPNSSQWRIKFLVISTFIYLFIYLFLTIFLSPSYLKMD